jgi:hypothetical protein
MEGTGCGFIRVPRSRVTRIGRNRLRIYRSANEQGVWKGKEQVADLSECQGTGYSGVESKRLRIYLKAIQQGGSVMEGRNRLQIYLKAKEQGVQVWKEVKELLQIYLNAEEQVSRSGRNRFLIYLIANEQSVNEWKEQERRDRLYRHQVRY